MSDGGEVFAVLFMLTLTSLIFSQICYDCGKVDGIESAQNRARQKGVACFDRESGNLIYSEDCPEVDDE